MDPKLTDFEQQLKSIAPAVLSDSLVDRLAEAMDAVAIEDMVADEKIISVSLDGELSALEESLRNLVPHGVPENMISRLDEAMSRWHEQVPVEEKIVPIQPQVKPEVGRVKIRLRSVAAVALLGAGASFLTTDYGEVPNSTARRIPVLTNGNTAPVVFTPGNARASVVSANDHGIVWTKEGLPIRCVEVELTNEVQFTNARGEKLIFAQPKREVMFTPVKFD